MISGSPRRVVVLGAGRVGAFYTDGLRTLREKTLRYPGHAEKMRMLREGGFFNEEPLSVGDVEIVPRQVTERKPRRQNRRVRWTVTSGASSG